MRINTAGKGVVAPELINVADAVVASDTAAVGTWNGPVGTTYNGMNNAVRDSVFGTGSVVGQYIEGTDGDDTLYGTARADDMFGGDGQDKLYGNAGNDRLWGGNGHDILNGGAGADILDGGEAADWASYTGSAAVIVNLAGVGSGGDAEGDIYISIENVVGSSFADTLIGDALDNSLDGGAGNDNLQGGIGNDYLTGNLGEDTLTGGAGADTFIFRHGTGVDHITDFEQGVDKIDLSFYFSPHLDIMGGDGRLATGWVTPDGLHGAENLDKSDMIFFDRASHTLYECDIDDAGTLILGAAILTVEANDVGALQASDISYHAPHHGHGWDF